MDDDWLVSWDGDGAIRLWDQQGKPLPGGAADAHPGGVNGVLGLNDDGVSCGEDKRGQPSTMRVVTTDTNHLHFPKSSLR
jgi:hypothetical protein